MATSSQDRAIARLAPAVERSRAEWRLLGTRLATITPRAFARGILATVVVLVAVGLAGATWPALLPFAVGGLLAYAIYPLVDSFARVMPRVLAAALALTIGLGVLGLVLALVVPPLVAVAIQILRDAPGSAELAQLRTQVEAYLATLPDGARTLVEGVLERVATIVAGNLSSFLDGVAELLVSAAVGLFDTIGFVVGLVLLPLWVLSVVRDGGSLRRSIAAQFAPAVAADVYALTTIVHRAMSTFLRVQVAAAFAVGLVAYAGMELSAIGGIATYATALAIAAWMGTAQVIPQLGGFVGAVPIVLVALARQDEPVAAIALAAIYLVAVQVVKLAVGGRLGRDLNVRPALALPAFAVISQIGLVWLLLSAPILVIARNAVVYLRGRLADPPAPAGVLPWERRRRPVPTTAAIPPLYRQAATRAGSGVATTAAAITAAGAAAITPAAPARPAAAPPTAAGLPAGSRPTT
jgi:predicted PurR-regulated permease PerM